VAPVTDGNSAAPLDGRIIAYRIVKFAVIVLLCAGAVKLFVLDTVLVRTDQMEPALADGDRVLGDYTAKEHVSKSYNLYSEPTHRELEQAARDAVRERIDRKLYLDADRLADALAGSGKPRSAASGQ